MRTVKYILLAGIYILSRTALGFPEMVRHGYANCLTCHFSPSGGGLLKDYGKTQASELLSTFSGCEVSPDGHLSFGGQFRNIQLLSHTARSTRLQYIVMQADAEAAAKVTIGSTVVTTVATAGLNQGKFLSRRHYAMAQWGPYSFRAGRFLPFFGLGLPDHYLNIRDGIGLGQGGERNSLEVGAMFEFGSTFVTVNLNDVFVRQSINIGKSQVGFSFWNNNPSYSGFAIVNLPYSTFLMTEAVIAKNTIKAYERLSWEFYKGMIIYAAAQQGIAPFWGGGLQLYPYPGIELRAEGIITQTGYNGWLMANLYL